MGEIADLPEPKGLGQIKRISPKDFQHAVDAGTAKIGEPPINPDSSILQTPVEKFAANLFGKDFIGKEALMAMQGKCQADGIDVKFIIPSLTPNFSPLELQGIKDTDSLERERMMIFRPGFMTVNGIFETITIRNLRKLFGIKNPFGNGKLFGDEDWYLKEGYESIIDEPMDAGYALPTKDLVPTSTNTDWHTQENLFFKFDASRRTAVEAVWDTIFYYATTGVKLLSDKKDATSTHKSGSFVYVGEFSDAGLEIGRTPFTNTMTNLGVVSQR